MVSSTTIDRLGNRSRCGWLCARVVNSGDQTEHLSRFPCTGLHGKTVEIGSREVLAPGMRVRWRATCASKVEAFAAHMRYNEENIRERRKP
jgi:hypothetical protein